MDTVRLLKWVVVVAVAFGAWKFGKPILEQQFGGDKAAAIAASGGCTRSAAQASEAWGSGLRQFASPPYDLEAWSSFRNGVEAKIAEAESECGCAEQSCVQAKSALGDLRNLVSHMDGALRNNAPLDDVVQRQEAIDMKINAAAALAQGGK